MRDSRCRMRDEQQNGGSAMNYRNLEIWQLSRQLTIDIHKMTLCELPGFEKFEEGAQIRRSMKSIKSNIVEGYGRRRYKQDFLRFLTYAHASCDETVDHLETMYETESLTDEALYQNIHDRLNTLGSKINRFIQGVELNHNADIL